MTWITFFEQDNDTDIRIVFQVHEIAVTSKCTKCMCKRTGFECVPHCPIKSCPKGHVLGYPKGQCCKCESAPCQAPKYRLECGCPRTCPALVPKTPKCSPQPSLCRKMVCTCPPGMFDDGTSCVKKSRCPCLVDGKLIQVTFTVPCNETNVVSQ